jgi:hypothetical protein
VWLRGTCTTMRQALQIVLALVATVIVRHCTATTELPLGSMNGDYSNNSADRGPGRGHTLASPASQLVFDGPRDQQNGTQAGATGECDVGSYVPSELEKQWQHLIHRFWNESMSLKQYCAHSLSKEMARRAPRKYEDGSCLTCSSQRMCLEPLVGLLRFHEFPCASDTKRTLFKKDHIWFDVPPRAPAARNLLFDLGASTFVSPHPNMDSQSWFVAEMAERGVVFDRIFAWEAKPLNSTQIWDGMPFAARSAMSYYNVPISADVNHADHPWRYLARHAAPRDFVVLKLDVDTASIEQRLMEQLLDSKVCSGIRCTPLHKLVDMVFYETHPLEGSYRVWRRIGKRGWPGWGATALNNIADLPGRYSIFRQLRQKGIIAHPWV